MLAERNADKARLLADQFAADEMPCCSCSGKPGETAGPFGPVDGPDG